MHRRTLLKADVLLPALVGLGLLVAAGSTLVPRLSQDNGPPLSGETLHDFGEAELRRASHELTHTFRLKNTSDSPITIERISTTCGCGDASLDREVVEPGDSLAVSCVLHLTDSGEKTAQIILVTNFQEQPIIRLTMQARGKRMQQLSALTRYVELRPDEMAGLLLIAVNYLDDEAPPEPIRNAPSGITTGFLGWSSIQKRDEHRGLPARWEGHLQIEMTGPGSLPKTPLAQLQVSLPEGPPLTVVIRTNHRD